MWSNSRVLASNIPTVFLVKLSFKGLVIPINGSKIERLSLPLMCLFTLYVNLEDAYKDYSFVAKGWLHNVVYQNSKKYILRRIEWKGVKNAFS